MVLEWPSTHQCTIPKKSGFGIFWMGWNPTQPNPRTGFCVHTFFWLTPPDLQRSVCFSFSHPSLPTPYLLLFPSFLSSLFFPLIISFSFFGTFSFFFLWFSFFFLYFLKKISVLCSFVWGLCNFFLFPLF
jgi:hypothetical protein